MRDRARCRHRPTRGEVHPWLLRLGLGAIASSVWDDMARADNGTTEETLQVLLLDFEGGKMAITTATERHLVCAYGGTDVAPGDMRSKLLALRQALEHDLGRIDAR